MKFFSGTKTPRSYQVILAASELGPYVPGLGQAYHTSILVDNMEPMAQGSAFVVECLRPVWGLGRLSFRH
eukprot:s1033_g14.t1